MDNIVLIGFMGSGKTVVGKVISERLNLKFVDIDRLIEEEQVHKRTQRDGSRPLLQVSYPEKTIEELLSFRESLYAQADFKVETSNLSIEEVVEEILNFVKKV